MDYLYEDNIIIEKEKQNKEETKLALRRRLLGYSQAFLAEKTGISLRTLQQYESKARDINKASIQTLWLLARALECPMEDLIDIYVDDITDCIRHKESGNDCVTRFEIISRVISKNESKIDKKNGWKFDWSTIQADGYNIIELFTENDNQVQGRISYKELNGYFFVDHVENSPHNIGKEGIYEGVGGNLFAIVCLLSKDAGNEGVVSFYSKSNPKLIKNYEEKLHAKRIGNSQLMILDEKAAEYLINKYHLEE